MRNLPMLCLSMLLAAASPAATIPLGNHFTVNEHGTIAVDGFSLGWSHFSQSWINTKDEAVIIPNLPTAYPANGPLVLKGRFPVRDGSFEITESIVVEQDSILNITLEATAKTPVPSMVLMMSASNSRLSLYGFETAAEGKHLVAEVFDDTKPWQGRLNGPVSLKTSLPHGTLSIESSHFANWQDERYFGFPSESLRFYMNGGEAGDISHATLKLRLSYRPVTASCVDFSATANVGFKDEVEGDGIGGWTDQGPANDFRNHPKPGIHNLEAIPFTIMNPEEHGGKSCIVLKSPNTPSYPETAAVTFKEKTQGAFLYLLHAVAWEKRDEIVGTIVAEYEDATTQSIPVKMGTDVMNWWEPQQIKNGLPVFLTMNDSASVGLLQSRFALQKKPLKSLAFASANVSCWMIVAASLTDDDIPQPSRRPYVTRNGKEWAAFKRDKDIEPKSILDFSYLLDAPAGKYGFVKPVGSHFEFEKRPGVPVRFWGGNTCFSCNYLTHEEADRLADELAAMGYNIVRFHHYDRDFVQHLPHNSTTINPVNAEKIDYLAATLKKRGIYLTLDFFTTRDVKPGELNEAPEGTQGSSGEYKALTYLSKSAYENWRQFATLVMNHVNPYTGLAWKDDPAFVQVCLVNEGNIHSAVWNLTDTSRAFFDKEFESMAANRQWDVTEANRPAYYEQFLTNVHRTGYARMAAYLRSIGVKMMFTDQNMISSPLLALMRQDYDVVDNHFYFQHPVFLEKSWQLPVGVAHVNVAGRFGGSLAYMFPARLANKPYAITEWDFCVPGHYATEGGLAVGAYGALQNWDLITRFAISHSREKTQKADTLIGFFDILNDPQRMLSERMGTLLFLRGDAKPAQSAFVIQVNETMYDGTGKKMPGNFPDILQRLGLIGLSASIVGESTPLSPHTKAVFGYTDKPGRNVGKIPYFQITDNTVDDLLEALLEQKIITREQYNPEQKCFTSETGEVICNHNENILSVVTPQSEGFSIMAGTNVRGKFMTVSNPSTYSCVMAASYSPVPLTQAKRILFLHLTETSNVLNQFRDETMGVLTKWGNAMAMLKRGTVNVSFAIGPKRSPKLYACSMTGKRLFEPQFTYDRGVLAFTADNFVKDTPVFAYELVLDQKP